MSKRPTNGGRHYRNPKTGKLSSTPPKGAADEPVSDTSTPATEAKAQDSADTQKGR